MRVILRARAETLTIQRDRTVTLASSLAYDPSTGADSGITITVGNDATSSALLNAAARGAEIIYCAGLLVGVPYRLMTTDGRALDIIPVAVSGTTVTLSARLPWAITGGTVYGVRSTATLTVPSAFTGRLLQIEYTLSDGVIQQESVLVASRRLVVPVTSEDILVRFPRLRSRTQGEVGFGPQIADVLFKTRAQFWGIGHVLDDFRSPALLKDYLIAEIALQLIASGYDLSSSGDTRETRREFTDLRDRELTMLQTSPHIWIDADENRRIDAGETGAVGGLRMDWRNRD